MVTDLFIRIYYRCVPLSSDDDCFPLALFFYGLIQCPLISVGTDTRDGALLTSTSVQTRLIESAGVC